MVDAEGEVRRCQRNRAQPTDDHDEKRIAREFEEGVESVGESVPEKATEEFPFGPPTFERPEFILITGFKDEEDIDHRTDDLGYDSGQGGAADAE